MQKKETAVPYLLHIRAMEGMSYEGVCETLKGCEKALAKEGKAEEI